MTKTQNAKLFGKNFLGPRQPSKANMAKKFLMPPFSVLDARSGEWLKRKRAWRQLGIRGEEGRVEGEGLGIAYGHSLDGFGHQLRDKYAAKEKKIERKKLGKVFGVQDSDYLRRKEGKRNENVTQMDTATSVFDPVLTELVYTWFTPTGGSIFDPFAGGSTRGVVASVLGYDYTGIDVRQQQIDANQKQAAEIGVSPTWICGDTMQVNKLLPTGSEFDLMFACPPYYDLEVYSIDNRDGSTHQTYEEFMDWYYKLFKRCVRFVKPNRFVVLTVGEIRDQKTGYYRNFVADTIDVFLDLGFEYYNEMILITPGGSLPLRAGRAFKATRKIGKSHQNILVFYKGDVSKIRDDFGTVELPPDFNIVPKSENGEV